MPEGEEFKAFLDIKQELGAHHEAIENLAGRMDGLHASMEQGFDRISRTLEAQSESWDFFKTEHQKHVQDLDAHGRKERADRTVKVVKAFVAGVAAIGTVATATINWKTVIQMLKGH